MRVLLINPPNKNMVDSEIPLAVNREVGVFPPLGLMYLGAYLERYTEYEVRILDTIAEDMDYQAIQRYIREYYPALIGVTAHTHNLLDVIEVARIAKEVSRQIHISLGGAHVKVFPQETIELPYVDSAVSGEGEIIFAELAKAIEQKKSLRGVKGLIFKEDGRVIDTGGAETINLLDSLPFPERTMIDPRNYYYLISEKINFTTMLSSRGCPYHCTFCSTPHGPYRVRSPENVVDEMQQCIDLGLGEIHFVDDTFNVLLVRVRDICDEILKRRLKIRWSFRGRVDTITREMLVKAKESGCVRIQFGVETDSDEGLKRLKKGINIEQIKRVFKWTRQIGITTIAYFMIGCPHERSKKDILDAINFAIQIDPDFAMFNVLTAYPGTEVYEEGLRKKIFKADPWRDFAVDPSKRFILPFWEEWISRDELLSLLNLAYRRFYLRPKFIFRTIYSLRSLKEFAKKLKAGIDIYTPAWKR